MFTKVQLECEGLWNNLAAARDAISEVVRNEVAASACNAEVVVARDNVRI